jgi:phosphoribosylamine--glycine ligase
MVVTGAGSSVKAARDNANGLVERVIIPNTRYRRDIGDRLIDGEYERVDRLGLLDPLEVGDHRCARRIDS